MLLPSDRWNGECWGSRDELRALSAPAVSASSENTSTFSLRRPLSIRMIDNVLSRPPSKLITTPRPCQHVKVAEEMAEDQQIIENSWNNDWTSLALVLSGLCPRDLVMAQAVCSQWRDVASLPEVRRASFCSTWRFRRLITGNDQRSWSCLQSVSSPQGFVLKHSIVAKESVQSIAVRHGCDLTSIKRLNNIISDNSLLSRSCIYVPAFKDINDLEGHGARYEYDSVSKRGYAVVFKLDEDELMESDIAFDEPENQLHQNQRAKNVTSAQSREAMMIKMSALLSKSLKIDEGTARYYLEETDGDMKAAVQLARLDDSWEHVAGSRTGRRHFFHSVLGQA